MTHRKKLAILVGGGPAPGHQQRDRRGHDPRPARGRRRGRRRGRLRVADAGQHRPRPPADHRGHLAHPLPRRLAHRHRAREPDQGSAAAREHRDLAAASGRHRPHHDRRRRHRVLGHEARGEVGGPHPRRARAQVDRQRPRPALVRGHVRLPDRAARGRRDRQEHHGGRQDHLALVLHHRDGPQGRSPGARASARPRARR